MLPRVLEPEVMDSREEAVAYDAMDHEEVNHRFVADFLEARGPSGPCHVLDVGTGTARIPILLCRADPDVQVIGIDLAESMLKIGRDNVEQASLAGRIRLERLDAKALELTDARFDAVISNSIIHHIPDPEPVLAGMVRFVRPGGTVFVRDLARPGSIEELERLVARYAGSEGPAARALFAASLHAALQVEELGQLLNRLGISSGSVTMTSDRHWTWSWQRPRN